MYINPVYPLVSFFLSTSQFNPLLISYYYKYFSFNPTYSTRYFPHLLALNIPPYYTYVFT